MNSIFSTVFKNSSINAEEGFNNETLFEPDNDFQYLKTSAETVLQGQNNTFIVLGRDRPGDVESGYGGRGHMKCGAIDIVAGRLSGVKATTLTDKKVNPNIGADAARIYLSQKADIDSYYSLPEGRTGKSVALSAIAIKADDLRFVARNSIKIVTNTDSFLSNGSRALLASGVQLIANNDDTDMQPIPKGDNLSSAINEILEKILELNGIVQALMEIQRGFNEAVTNHTHISPFNGIPTSPSPEALPAGKQALMQMLLKVEQGLKLHTGNLMAYKTRFLMASSKEYINSSYHFLN